MRKVFAVVLIMAASSFGQSAPPKPVSIMFDDWWNIDYVKKAANWPGNHISNLAHKPLRRRYANLKTKWMWPSLLKAYATV